MSKPILRPTAVLMLVVTPALAFSDEPPRQVVHATSGMVAAAQPQAAAAGVEILKQGGSAVDAAIAVNACLAVMEPISCGLGGDLFAIVWDPKARKLVGLNASGRAPAALTIEKVRPEADGTIPLYSPYAWTVPGAADGWFELHERYGKLSLEKVLAPAIAAARDGFAVTPVIAEGWARAATVFADKPGFKEVFMPGGRPPRAGENFKNPALARTLATLVAERRAAIRKGGIARAIVAYSGEHGGFFALGDFESHRSTWDEPISTTYRGYTVWEMPPPGQGLAALQMLNILERFDLKAMGRGSADWWHVMTEAKKLAYADRARYYADPAFSKVPVQALLSKDYAARRAALIDLKRAAVADPPGDPEAGGSGAVTASAPALDRRETTYLTTADASGMMVSLIQSNYAGFGSGYVIPSLGYGIQNRGALFSLDAKHPNALAPGKRPFHTIIPAFVTKGGHPWLSFGLMGGDMQAQGHAQVLSGIIDLGMDLQAAGDAPRFHHTGSTEPTGTVMKAAGILHVEPGVPANIVEELRRRGHRIEPEATSQFGGYQAIARDPKGGYIGATEKRKDGVAAGWDAH